MHRSTAAVIFAIFAVTVLFYLHPINSAYHLPSDTLVGTDDYEKFRSTPQSQSIAEFPGETFQFGIATAPAHIEDQLDDSWAEWARKGRIPFNDGTKRDLDRLRFWTEPETEIQLAASTGAKLFRFGIDWGRLQPHEPGSRFCSFQGYRIHNGSDDTPFQAAHEYHDQFHGSSFNQKAGERSESSINDQHVMFSRLRADRRAHIPLSTKRVMADRRWACRRGVQDKLALKRYLYIIQLIKRAGMRPHLTLFHHSLPRWANAAQHRGWLNEKTTRYFVDYLRDLIPHLAGQVSDYVVFNEPAVFASLVYGMAMWPGRLRETPDYFSIIFNTPIYKSAVYTAYSNMADAHRQAYSLIHEIHRRKKLSSPKVGVAHNIAWYQPSSAVFNPLAVFMNKLMNWDFMDLIAPQWVDFIGLNYYGAEYVSLKGSAILSGREYSESGRSIYPEGLYWLLLAFHRRYNSEEGQKQIPFLITENGISDGTDVLRPAYLIEHLLAVRRAMDDGVPVEGFVFWTVSDNWEWADGYCPRFGLFSVDRSTGDLQRLPRPSARLFKSICETGLIREEQREEAWSLVRASVGQNRPFCRAADGRATVNQTVYRPFLGDDSWRFVEPSKFILVTPNFILG